MKRSFRFLSSHKKAILLSIILLGVGACFRWEVREIDDAATGAAITRSRGIVFPWQPCGVSIGGSKRINFHVTHWMAYGLVRLEATGQTY